MTEPEVLDACGLSCPLPLLKMKQVLNRLEPGQQLRVYATDAGSKRDFQVFSAQSGHKLLESTEIDGIFTYLLEKAPKKIGKDG